MNHLHHNDFCFHFFQPFDYNTNTLFIHRRSERRHQYDFGCLELFPPRKRRCNSMELFGTLTRISTSKKNLKFFSYIDCSFKKSIATINASNQSPSLLLGPVISFSRILNICQLVCSKLNATLMCS